VSGTIRDDGTQDVDVPQPDNMPPRPIGNRARRPSKLRTSDPDIDEDVIPPEDKPVVRRVAEANIQLRRWIVAGIGVLAALILLITPLSALIRPELADFARNFLQIALTGLFGLGGTVVGFLFAREENH
jgi:hypothetical protein